MRHQLLSGGPQFFFFIFNMSVIHLFYYKCKFLFLFTDLVFKNIQMDFKFRIIFLTILLFYFVCIIVLYSALICIAGVCAI